MSREVDEVLAVWRALERVRESLPVGSTERTLVSREIRETKRLYRSLTHGVGESRGAFDNSLAGAHAALRRAKLKLERAGAATSPRCRCSGTKHPR